MHTDLLTSFTLIINIVETIAIITVTGITIATIMVIGAIETSGIMAMIMVAITIEEVIEATAVTVHTSNSN
jgi:hypothetical protein